MTSTAAHELKRAFDAHFAGAGRFSMTLPDDALGRAAGGFEEHGWEVAYRFTTDAGGAPVLDCLATHRMTNDRLYRIHRDGRVELLGSSTDGMVPDAERDFTALVRRHGFG